MPQLIYIIYVLTLCLARRLITFITAPTNVKKEDKREYVYLIFSRMYVLCILFALIPTTIDAE